MFTRKSCPKIRSVYLWTVSVTGRGWDTRRLAGVTPRRRTHPQTYKWSSLRDLGRDQTHVERLKILISRPSTMSVTYLNVSKG